MLETKSLINSIKGELYDDLLSSIDQEYLGNSITAPAELIPYMQGKKAETEEEGKKIRQIFNAWGLRIKRALGRTKDATQQVKIMREVLGSMPEPWKTGVMKALVR